MLGVTKAVGRMFGEGLSNVPLGNLMASQYPEYGIPIGEKRTPTRKELFGKGDPTRFGSGILASKALSDPLFKLLLPYGGTQLKKTLQGWKALGEGEKRTKAGTLQYEIGNTPGNKIRGSFFGQSSFPEAQEFYDKRDAPKTNTKSSDRYNVVN